MKINKYIEIVGSSNPRLNAMAKDSRLSVLNVLQSTYSRVGITLVDNMDDLEALVAKRPDLVVLGMKLVLLEPELGYEASPKLWLSSYLNEHGIAFTGSDTEALSTEFDKPLAKQVVIDHGLNSAPYLIAPIGQTLPAHTLGFPLFVKPTNRGDSKGIDEQSVAYTDSDLQAKVKSIHDDCGSPALIEEFLPGREFSVAIMAKSGLSDLLAMPIEITTPVDTRGNSFLSEVVKHEDTERVLPVTDPLIARKLNALARGVFKALGSRDYGRIDLRLDAKGEPHFIEANLMPGLSSHGYMSRCFALNHEAAYAEMILSIVDLALRRRAVRPFRSIVKPIQRLHTIKVEQLA